MKFRLLTPFHRALFLACCAAFMVGAVWRIATVPVGYVHPNSAITFQLSQASGTVFFLPALQESDVPDPETSPPKFDWRYRHFGERCSRNVNPFDPQSPDGMLELGLFLCNEANVPKDQFDEMRPTLRDAAIRDIESYALRILAVPFFGLVASVALLLAALCLHRVGKWIGTGN